MRFDELPRKFNVLQEENLVMGLHVRGKTQRIHSFSTVGGITALFGCEYRTYFELMMLYI